MKLIKLSKYYGTSILTIRVHEETKSEFFDEFRRYFYLLIF